VGEQWGGQALLAGMRFLSERRGPNNNAPTGAKGASLVPGPADPSSFFSSFFLTLTFKIARSMIAIADHQSTTREGIFGVNIKSAPSISPSAEAKKYGRVELIARGEEIKDSCLGKRKCEQSLHKELERESIYNGVVWNQIFGKWQVEIEFLGETHCIGFYDTEEKAAQSFIMLNNSAILYLDFQRTVQKHPRLKEVLAQ
jgi:hypothetical protein